MTGQHRIGVIIGRFQVPYLHKGHMHLINHVKNKSTGVIVLIGDSGLINLNNPLDYKTRKRMFEPLLESGITGKQAFHIAKLNDIPGDNGKWSRTLDDTVMNMLFLSASYEQVTLYGSRDSFLPSYSGMFKKEEVEPVYSLSGTELRTTIGWDDPENNVMFRKGMIYVVEQIFAKK